MARVKNALASTHEEIVQTQKKTSVNQGKHVLSCLKVHKTMIQMAPHSKALVTPPICTFRVEWGCTSKGK